MIETLIQELQSQSVWDVIVLVTGIIYVLYASKNNPVCWVWGILCCGILAYLSFTKYQLYADAGLNVFYVIMGFVGIYSWQFGADRGERAITNISVTEILVGIIGGLVVSYFVHHYLSNFTAAVATQLDAVTTVFSIIATIWLVQRKIETWLLWIIVDILYIYLYFTRGAILFGILYIVYTIISVRGFIFWRNEKATQYVH